MNTEHGLPYPAGALGDPGMSERGLNTGDADVVAPDDGEFQGLPELPEGSEGGHAPESVANEEMLRLIGRLGKWLEPEQRFIVSLSYEGVGIAEIAKQRGLDEDHVRASFSEGMNMIERIASREERGRKNVLAHLGPLDLSEESVSSLTSGERRYLALLISGLPYEEAAQKLVIDNDEDRTNLERAIVEKLRAPLIASLQDLARQAAYTATEELYKRRPWGSIEGMSAAALHQMVKMFEGALRDNGWGRDERDERNKRNKH